MIGRQFICGTLLAVAWLATGVASSTAAIQHPLTVRVTALDPVRHGATVRVRVDATSRVDLERTEIRLVSAGGAAVATASRAGLGRMRPGRPAGAQFTVRLPAQGHRVLLQFRVTGEGIDGVASRGATLNLLPDGPADPGREVTIGGERVIEYRARRIDR